MFGLSWAILGPVGAMLRHVGSALGDLGLQWGQKLTPTKHRFGWGLFWAYVVYVGGHVGPKWRVRLGGHATVQMNTPAWAMLRLCGVHVGNPVFWGNPNAKKNFKYNMIYYQK